MQQRLEWADTWVTVLFLFLSARVALWVAAGIPVAMRTATALMRALGFTLNMITRFGLIITLGMVVDDAIAADAHAGYRARNLGESPAAAAENAAIRMSAPVSAGSVTPIIASFGLVAVGGRFGTLIAGIPFAVIVVLGASLLVCFFILPSHMRHALSRSRSDGWLDAPSRLANSIFRWFRQRLCLPLISGVISFRYPVTAAPILWLASQMALFLRGDVNWRFFNAPELGSVSEHIAMLPGATIPFGRVGAIHGHYLWDAPLSIYSVVGLIGMLARIHTKRRAGSPVSGCAGIDRIHCWSGRDLPAVLFPGRRTGRTKPPAVPDLVRSDLFGALPPLTQIARNSAWLGADSCALAGVEGDTVNGAGIRLPPRDFPTLTTG